MRLLSRFLIGLALLWQAAAAAAATGAGLPSPAEIDEIMRQLADITGFQIRRQLPFQMVNREQVNAFLKEQIRRTVKPEDVRAEEVTLRKFGFVPADFDLRKTTLDLLTEQAAAYYDFNRKKLFISDWASQNMRDEAMVHELAHALADQNFSIRKFLAGAGDDSESATARETVVEGQASWLMIEYAARRAGRTLADADTARNLLREHMDDADSDYPVFSKAPLYIRTTLIFPYEEGERFQQILYARQGKTAFAEPFRRPPASTAQILHPDRYLSGVKPALPQLPKPAPHSKAFVKGSMGELDHSILLRQFVDRATAQDLAPRLESSSYRIDLVKNGGRMTLVYASAWRDEAAATAFFAAYRKVLQSKWKNLEVASESPSVIQGRGDDGFFALTRNGAVVMSQEGFERPIALN